jgi:small subunit ribosomal protein S13
MNYNFQRVKNSTEEFIDYGINFKLINFFSLNLGINLQKRSIKLKKRLYFKLASTFKQLRTGKQLQKAIHKNIDFLIKIKTYKGIRHKLKYPARGQRTHTNAKTKKKFLYKKL